jgi:hypothetical protein
MRVSRFLYSFKKYLCHYMIIIDQGWEKNREIKKKYMGMKKMGFTGEMEKRNKWKIAPKNFYNYSKGERENNI